MIGGVFGLVATIILGPREGRFDHHRKKEFKPHNQGNIALGTIILWFGWYGFNGGSEFSIVGESA